MDSESIKSQRQFEQFQHTYHNLTKTRIEKRGDNLYINYQLDHLNSDDIERILAKLYHQIQDNFGTIYSLFLGQFRIGKFLFSSKDSNFRWFYPSTNTRIHTEEWITLNMKEPMKRIVEKLHIPSNENDNSDPFATSSAHFLAISNLEIIIQPYPTL